MKAVKFGIWIMVLALVSTIVTIPFKFGIASGTAFVMGMVVSWAGGLWILTTWLIRRRNRTVS